MQRWDFGVVSPGAQAKLKKKDGSSTAFDFEEPEKRFSRATGDLDRFSRARRSRGSHFLHCHDESIYQRGLSLIHI